MFSLAGLQLQLQVEAEVEVDDGRSVKKGKEKGEEQEGEGENLFSVTVVPPHPHYFVLRTPVTFLRGSLFLFLRASLACRIWRVLVLLHCCTVVLYRARTRARQHTHAPTISYHIIGIYITATYLT